MKRLLVVVVTVLAGLTLAASPAFAYRMKINEIYYNSPGSDTGSGTSLNGEWVQLHNTSGATISLTNWTVRDVAGHVYTFGSYSIGPYKYVKVHTGSGTSTATDRYWNMGWYVWNNDADTATLKDGSGTTIGACSYNSTAVSYKLC
jgi:Lamin Tail Domain